MYEAKWIYYLNIHKDINIVPVGTVANKYNHYYYDTISQVYLTYCIEDYEFVKNLHNTDKVFILTNSRDVKSFLQNNYPNIFIDIPDPIRMYHTPQTVFDVIDTDCTFLRQFGNFHQLLVYDTQKLTQYISDLTEVTDTVCLYDKNEFEQNYNTKLNEISQLVQDYQNFYDFCKTKFTVVDNHGRQFYVSGKKNFILTGKVLSVSSSYKKLGCLFTYNFQPANKFSGSQWFVPKELSSSQDIEAFVNNGYISAANTTENYSVYTLNKFYDFDLDEVHQSYLNSVK